MFSFFKSSKKSPVATPTEPNKTDESTQRNGDDFVLIGGGNAPLSPLYPSVQPPARPAPPTPQHPVMNRQQSVVLNYTAQIPFKLNPALVSSTNNDSELWGFKIREMNAQFQRVSTADYDFKLERSIVDS